MSAASDRVHDEAEAAAITILVEACNVATAVEVEPVPVPVPAPETGEGKTLRSTLKPAPTENGDDGTGNSDIRDLRQAMYAASDFEDDPDLAEAIAILDEAGIDFFGFRKQKPALEPALTPEAGEGLTVRQAPQPAPTQPGSAWDFETDAPAAFQRYIGEDRDTEITELLKKELGPAFKYLDLSKFLGCYIHSLLASSYPKRKREPQPPPTFRVPRAPPKFNHIEMGPVDKARQAEYESYVKYGTLDGSSSASGAGASTRRVAKNGACVGASAGAGPSWAKRTVRSSQTPPSGAKRTTDVAGSSRTPRTAKINKNTALNGDAAEERASAVKRTPSSAGLSRTPRAAKKQKAAPSGDAVEQGASPSSAAGGVAEDDGADHDALDLPKADVVLTRKGGYKVRNVDVYFMAHPTKKAFQICRNCGVEAWPPNRQKHIVKCINVGKGEEAEAAEEVEVADEG